MSLAEKQTQLLKRIEEVGPCAVAFSGGVDSAVVAVAALQVHGDGAIAITGVSPSLAADERELAKQTAAGIGIQHREIETEEFTQEAYTRNAPDRCFHCKSQLYSRLTEIAPQLGFKTILNGANVDDLGDYRPGLKAASDFQVISPLAECGFTKTEVRELAREWKLDVWDKPASPCLSSRVAYGETVTPERLAMIDQAESFLRGLGLLELRVRYHKNDLARIEVPTSEIPRLCEPDVREALIEKLTAIGFRFVTLDLEGFRSGNLNSLHGLVSIDGLEDLTDAQNPPVNTSSDRPSAGGVR